MQTSDIKLIQTELKRLGYYKKKIDGLQGSGTNSAVLQALKKRTKYLPKGWEKWSKKRLAVAYLQIFCLENKIDCGKVDGFYGSRTKYAVGKLRVLKQGTKTASKGKIILSFDDGPKPVKPLTKIIEVLDKNGISAEFYVVGNEVYGNSSGAKLIVKKGHKIQNHSWNHENLAKLSEDEIYESLNKTQKIIKKTTGATATKIRPPYGAGGWPGNYDQDLQKVAKKLSLKILNWDIDTKDWASPKGMGKDKMKSIEKQFSSKPGRKEYNVLMHVQSQTARDLQKLINYLKGKGYIFA